MLENNKKIQIFLFYYIKSSKINIFLILLFELVYFSLRFLSLPILYERARLPLSGIVNVKYN